MEWQEQKDVIISYKGKDEVFTIKKLTFGEYNDMQQESAPMEVTSTVQKLDINYAKMRELTITKCLVKAPFSPINTETIRTMPMTTGLTLYNEIDKFNALDETKKEGLEHS